MRDVTLRLIAAGFALGAAACSPAGTGPKQPPDWLSEAQATMDSLGVQGWAVAEIRGGTLVSTHSFGVRNQIGDPLTEETVMYGASLTKSAFAYLVLQLVDEGLLGLDQPIAEILPKPLPDYKGFRRTHAPWETLEGDERWMQITPRMALTHSTGFRNFNFITLDGEFRWDEGTVDIHFDPGTQFSYSGDGFILLQFVLEQGLGLDVGEEMRERIFRPLGMEKTDLIWRDDFADNLADGWTLAGDIVPHDDRSKVRASGSMDTTILDAGKLFAAMVRCEGLSTESCSELWTSSFPIRTASQFPLMQDDAPADEQHPGLGAGLGVILVDSPQSAVFFKGGHNDSTGNMAVCVEATSDCLVLLANDVRAEAGFPKIIEQALGPTGVPWAWEYPSLEFAE